jgi:DUF1365 family protein
MGWTIEGRNKECYYFIPLDVDYCVKCSTNFDFVLAIIKNTFLRRKSLSLQRIMRMLRRRIQILWGVLQIIMMRKER